MRAESRLDHEVCLLRRLTVERRAFFLPDDELAQLAGYCTGEALRKAPEVHLSVMSLVPDGPRCVIHDARTQRSDFKREFYSLLARAQNGRLDRRGDSAFRPPPGDDCRQLDRDKMLDSIVEVIVTPVRLGYCKSHKDWPGFQITPSDWGKTHTFQRPDFFRDDMLPQVTVEARRPPGFEELDDDELREMIRRRVNRREREIQEEFARTGREFLGRKGLRALVAGQRPKEEPAHARRLPRFAASDPEVEARERERVRQFEKDHETARRRMLDRKPRQFPRGTYWWRIFSDQPVLAPSNERAFAPP